MISTKLLGPVHSHCPFHCLLRLIFGLMLGRHLDIRVTLYCFCSLLETCAKEEREGYWRAFKAATLCTYGADTFAFCFPPRFLQTKRKTFSDEHSWEMNVSVVNTVQAVTVFVLMPSC